MRISEVSEKTGLDISSIRFYERKGLIAPVRSKESKYRDYTEEDIQRLKTIMLYRKMNFSIENIHRLILENGDLAEALEEQKKTLVMEREQIDGAINLCNKILQDNPGESMDLDLYLNFVREEEEKGSKFPTVIPVLDKIAENSGMENLLGYPFAAWIQSHAWMRRGMSVLMFLILIVFPVYQVSFRIYDFAKGGTNATGLVFWGFYFIMCFSVFMNMAGIGKGKGN